MFTNSKDFRLFFFFFFFCERPTFSKRSNCTRLFFIWWLINETKSNNLRQRRESESQVWYRQVDQRLFLSKTKKSWISLKLVWVSVTFFLPLFEIPNLLSSHYSIYSAHFHSQTGGIHSSRDLKGKEECPSCRNNNFFTFR